MMYQRNHFLLSFNVHTPRLSNPEGDHLERNEMLCKLNLLIGIELRPSRRQVSQ